MELSAVESDVSALISQKQYPCIAAVQALHRKELMFDTYEGFGTGQSSRRLAEKLIAFKKDQLEKQIPYLTYMAIFPNDISSNEDDFEKGLWTELSAMWSHPDIAGNWDPNFSDDPADRNFCFSLDGTAFFVVGLHPESSRLSRRLPYNALIFNLYSQFTALMDKGQYHAMVKMNRQRDLRFQGSVNPMAEAHNEDWEAIQFSGKNNSNEWRCPFTKGISKGLSWMLNI
jgi:FPC/CPF motif-containing protein YcgG